MKYKVYEVEYRLFQYFFKHFKVMQIAIYAAPIVYF